MKKKRKKKKPKPVYILIEGTKLNEKTGILEPYEKKIKIKGCGI